MHFPKGFLAAFSNFWNWIFWPFLAPLRIYTSINKFIASMIIRVLYASIRGIVGRVVCRFETRFFSFLERWNWKIIGFILNHIRSINERRCS